MTRSLTRSRALIVHQGKILLMRRVKGELEYHTLLGGKVEAGETPEDACLREVMEECGVTCSITRELYRTTDIHEDILNTHIIYECAYGSGEPVLSGEELERATPDNLYQPLWVDLETAKTLNLVPALYMNFVQEFLRTR